VVLVSGIGTLALVTGVIALVAGSAAMLATLAASMGGLWVIATARHTLTSGEREPFPAAGEDRVSKQRPARTTG
jgi:hypothetical protein